MRWRKADHRHHAEHRQGRHQHENHGGVPARAWPERGRPIPGRTRGVRSSVADAALRVGRLYPPSSVRSSRIDFPRRDASVCLTRDRGGRRATHPSEVYLGPPPRRRLAGFPGDEPNPHNGGTELPRQGARDQDGRLDGGTHESNNDYRMQSPGGNGGRHTTQQNERCCMNVVEANDLGKRYGSTWALRECTLAVPEAHLAWLVGPNGAGKTTLLNLAVGLTDPSSEQFKSSAVGGRGHWPRRWIALWRRTRRSTRTCRPPTCCTDRAT